MAAELAIADALIEIKSVCVCGRKATMNLRVDAEGRAIAEGDFEAAEGRLREALALDPVALNPRLDLVDLLTAPDPTVLHRWGRRYLAHRDPRWVRRNALVALGNSAQPANPRVVAVLADYRSHADPILREHAEWATERLGLETR